MFGLQHSDLQHSGNRLCTNQAIARFTIQPNQARSNFIENTLIFLACLSMLVAEHSWDRRLWDAQLADLTLVVEPSNADVECRHWDLPVRSSRRAEKIDRPTTSSSNPCRLLFQILIV